MRGTFVCLTDSQEFSLLYAPVEGSILASRLPGQIGGDVPSPCISYILAAVCLIWNSESWCRKSNLCVLMLSKSRIKLSGCSLETSGAESLILLSALPADVRANPQHSGPTSRSGGRLNSYSISVLHKSRKPLFDLSFNGLSLFK